MAAAYGVSRRSNKRIHFVESDNLNDELDELEIEVNESERCAECGREVDPGNVGAIIRQDDEYRVVCEKEKCLDTYDLE